MSATSTEIQGSVDEKIYDVLSDVGFGPTGTAWVDGSSLYAKAHENSDARYLGRVAEPADVRRDIEIWFEQNGASL